MEEMKKIRLTFRDGAYYVSEPGNQDGEYVRAEEAESRIKALEKEVEGLRMFRRSVEEALNSGDGSYRP